MQVAVALLLDSDTLANATTSRAEIHWCGQRQLSDLLCTTEL